MEDDLAWDAEIKRHCTVSEALNVGRNMRAKYVLLTHFSQRYSKLAILPDKCGDVSNVALAYDNMTVRKSGMIN